MIVFHSFSFLCTPIVVIAWSKEYFLASMISFPVLTSARYLLCCLVILTRAQVLQRFMEQLLVGEKNLFHRVLKILKGLFFPSLKYFFYFKSLFLILDLFFICFTSQVLFLPLFLSFTSVLITSFFQCVYLLFGISFVPRVFVTGLHSVSSQTHVYSQFHFRWFFLQ